MTPSCENDALLQFSANDLIKNVTKHEQQQHISATTTAEQFISHSDDRSPSSSSCRRRRRRDRRGGCQNEEHSSESDVPAIWGDPLDELATANEGTPPPETVRGDYYDAQSSAAPSPVRCEARQACCTMLSESDSEQTHSDQDCYVNEVAEVTDSAAIQEKFEQCTERQPEDAAVLPVEEESHEDPPQYREQSIRSSAPNSPWGEDYHLYAQFADEDESVAATNVETGEFRPVVGEREVETISQEASAETGAGDRDSHSEIVMVAELVAETPHKDTKTEEGCKADDEDDTAPVTEDAAKANDQVESALATGEAEADDDRAESALATEEAEADDDRAESALATEDAKVDDRAITAPVTENTNADPQAEIQLYTEDAEDSQEDTPLITEDADYRATPARTLEDSKSEIELLRSLVETSEAKITALNREIEHLKKALQEGQLKNEDLHLRLNNAINHVQIVSTRRTKVESEAAETQSELKKLSDAFKKLSDELVQVRGAKDRSEREAAKKLTLLQRVKDHADQEIADLQDSIEEFKSHRMSMRAQLRRAEDDATQKQHELTERSREVEALRLLVDHRDAQIARLIKAHQQDISAVRREMRRLQQDHLSLLARIEND